MIENTLLYLASILALTTLTAFGHAYLPRRFARNVPLVLLLYALVMVLASLELWARTPAIDAVRTTTLSNLLPAMIVLMLLQFRVATFARLGAKLLIAYFGTTLSFVVAFGLSYALLSFALPAHSNGALAALSASWSGGMANMLAVAGAIHLDEKMLGMTILVDTLLYGVWLLSLLALVPFAARFNRAMQATQADFAPLDESCPIGENRRLYVRIILGAIALAMGINLIAQFLPTVGFLSPSLYSVLLATLLGVALSFTSLGRIVGTSSVAHAMLYLIIALIASHSSFAGFGSVGMLLVAGALVLVIHALFMLALARIFHLDLFSIGVASLAHVGGMASAPILASSYHPSLIPVGVAMASVGYMLGTVVGLSVAWVLGVF
ncbi:MAG: hypothetical protein KU37_05895 [Sulfuricurvum sp. PC08-66]|nr:MAG: hypothetical protein KU37_05895 [Sulfuricurvum sp. PC08-66]